ncbi:3-hydroxybutyrate dehydrogenase [Natronorubrum texcoconense]|uniref:3-hydroxybutyrate dehydrogenase n=2 Tax=Natronorubrum texcoconense TaxID=1095776 RepID=A0A1G9DX59_9EURY|nr:3-hydroxybutyrate dehydrogenase [Natronorubrum texcoconense]
MADMTVDEAMERYGPTEPTADDFLVLDDPHYAPENVALVTGAGSGIGRATALAFAANGLTVAGTDLNESDLEAVRSTAEELSLPGEIVPIVGDLTVDEDLERIVDEAADHGSIRYLANIAGLQHIAPIESFPLEKYDTMQAVMQRAPFVLSKACLPHFRDNEDGGGVVANMCSVHGHIVTRDKVAYNTTKFGLRGLTQSIAAEGDGRVRAFSVSTAYVKTALVARQLPATADRRGMTVDEVVENVMLERTRVKELMEPYEVANLFVTGCSTHSTHLNGGDMTHEGGMSLTY